MQSPMKPQPRLGTGRTETPSADVRSQEVGEIDERISGTATMKEVRR